MFLNEVGFAYCIRDQKLKSAEKDSNSETSNEDERCQYYWVAQVS